MNGRWLVTPSGEDIKHFERLSTLWQFAPFLALLVMFSVVFPPESLLEMAVRMLLLLVIFYSTTEIANLIFELGSASKRNEQGDDPLNPILLHSEMIRKVPLIKVIGAMVALSLFILVSSWVMIFMKYQIKEQWAPMLLSTIMVAMLPLAFWQIKLSNKVTTVWNELNVRYYMMGVLTLSLKHKGELLADAAGQGETKVSFGGLLQSSAHGYAWERQARTRFGLLWSMVLASGGLWLISQLMAYGSGVDSEVFNAYSRVFASWLAFWLLILFLSPYSIAKLRVLERVSETCGTNESQGLPDKGNL